MLSATTPLPSPGKKRTKRAASKKSGKQAKGILDYVMPSLYLAIWMAASSALIVMNKKLLVDDRFDFPLALTGAGQTASFGMGYLVAKAGLMRLGKPPSAAFFMTRLLPVVICSAGTLFFGNVSYLYLSVSFIQILKVATPAFTLTICSLMGLERPSWPLGLSVLMIVAGTGLATFIESGAAGFSWLGFSCFTFSAFLEAVRVVYIQLLLGSLNYNAVEVLVWLGPPTSLLLFAGSYLWEYDGLVSRGFALVAARPLAYLGAVLMGFLVNMSTAMAIQATSSLTFKVCGCVKNTLVVWCGILLGDRVDAMQMLGYGLSMAGFVLYSRAKLLQSQAEHRQRRANKKAA